MAENTDSVTPEEGQAVTDEDTSTNFDDIPVTSLEPEASEPESEPFKAEIRWKEFVSTIKRPETKRNIFLGLTVLLILAFVLTVSGVLSLLNRPNEIIQSEASPSLDPDPEVRIDQEPFNPEGVQSWTEWEKVATPEQREALLAMSKGVVTSELTAKWAAEEAIMGHNFQTELSPGTPITNTGINANGWYSLDYSVKEGDTAFLATDKGVPVVKVSCGNPVGPPTNRPPEVKGANPYPNWIGEHQDSVPVPPPTPGYTPGNAEKVHEKQYSEPIGGLDPTPYGTPGTGSGGVTPPGQTEQPDGTVIVTPPPPDEPPAPPPPLNEVPAGAVVPPPED